MVESKEIKFSFEDVRSKSSEIARLSRDLVHINKDNVVNKLIPRINEYISSRGENGWLPEGHEFPVDQECGLNLFLNVVNYCYKDPDTGHEYFYTSLEGKRLNRATGFIAALARSGVDWSNFSEVKEISIENWRKMTQISEINPMYLGNERRDKITGFANHLLSSDFSNMTDYLNGCCFDVSKMTKFFNESGYFDDKFMKRSQLACRMIDDVLIRRGDLPLENIDKLTVMADYRIPQVFYNLGVVDIVDKDLETRLVRGNLILSDSREENALRATAVIVGELVAYLLNVTEAEVDGLLWGLSQDMVRKGEMIIPHMIVATDAY